MKTYLLLMASILVSGVLSNLAFCELMAPQFTLELSNPKGPGKLIARPPAGHHFNVDAPMSLRFPNLKCKDLKPSASQAKEVDFEISKVSCGTEAVVSLYICDDAGKFCEKHELNTNLSVAVGGSTAVTGVLVEKQNTQNKQSESASLEQDEHGFYNNNPKKAFKVALDQQSPMIIDFYGIWCPPCNELSDLVFSKTQFKKAARSFVKLMLDVDSPATDELSIRYRVTGYPTVIFTNSKGDELARVLGYRPLNDFLAQMKELKSEKSQTVAELEKQAKSGDQAAAIKLGMYYYNNSEYAKAVNYLPKDSEKSYGAYAALFEEKEKSGDKSVHSNRIKVLQEAVAAFPNSPDEIDRLESLAQIFEDSKDEIDAKQARKDLIVRAQALIAHPENLKGYDSDVGGLWVSVAEAQDSLGDKKAAAQAWESAIAQYQAKIKAGDFRGGSLELAYCLRKSDRVPEAMELYEKLEKAYPAEFTFYFGHARALFALKRATEALPLAKLAVDHSYGMNRLNSAELLAKIHKELNEKAVASQVLKAALETIPPPSPSTPPGPESRLRKKVEQLTQMQHELSAS